MAFGVPLLLAAMCMCGSIRITGYTRAWLGGVPLPSITSAVVAACSPVFGSDGGVLLFVAIAFLAFAALRFLTQSAQAKATLRIGALAVAVVLLIAAWLCVALPLVKLIDQAEVAQQSGVASNGAADASAD
jgi:hypothetical protein